METELTVTRLSTTPVKGLALHHPDTIELTYEGAAGDRAFFLVDDSGKIQSCTDNAALFGLRATWDSTARRLVVARGDDVLHGDVVAPARTDSIDFYGVRTVDADAVADPTWSELFSELLERRVRLMQARGSAYDVYPVTLVGTGSVRELARHVPGAAEVDSRRFRMLIELSTDEPHVEDTWAGSRLEVGEAVLRAGGPVMRCAATTRDPDSGEVNLQTLRLINSYRGRQESELGVGTNFGVYGAVVEPGRISVGDRLRVVPRTGRGPGSLAATRGRTV